MTVGTWIDDVSQESVENKCISTTAQPIASKALIFGLNDTYFLRGQALN